MHVLAWRPLAPGGGPRHSHGIRFPSATAAGFIQYTPASLASRSRIKRQNPRSVHTPLPAFSVSVTVRNIVNSTINLLCCSSQRLLQTASPRMKLQRRQTPLQQKQQLPMPGTQPVILHASLTCTAFALCHPEHPWVWCAKGELPADACANSFTQRQSLHELVPNSTICIRAFDKPLNNSQ